MAGAFFPETIRLRAPKGLAGAVKQAAQQRHQTACEWARQTLLKGLEAQGFTLPPDDEAERRQ